MRPVFFFAVSFVVGSIPTAYLFGRIFKHIDIRREGSGNVGATNAFRVLGKGMGIAVLALDLAKGAVPVVLARVLGGISQDPTLFLVGIAAVLGHVFSPFLGFSGGKGVATGAGVLCAVFPLIFLCALAVWIGAFIGTRVVSVSSLLAAAALVPLSVYFKKETGSSLLLAVVFLLVLWTHRDNISRFFKGEERRLF